jgi:hypothetical protein
MANERLGRRQRIQALIFIVVATLAMCYGMYEGFYLSDSDDDSTSPTQALQAR